MQIYNIIHPGKLKNSRFTLMNRNNAIILFGAMG